MWVFTLFTLWYIVVYNGNSRERREKRQPMTSVVLPKSENMPKARELIASLRSDPEIMEAIEQGMKARLEGRVKPWSKVKEELGIR